MIAGRLTLPPATRRALWSRVGRILEAYTEGIAKRPVARNSAAADVRKLLAPHDFAQPQDPLAVIAFLADLMDRHHVHNAHPRYFGLFVPAPASIGIAAEALAAAFNPALGAWQLSPAGVELEDHTVRLFCRRFGYPETANGVFTSGGAEANTTALLLALTKRFSQFPARGIRSCRGAPTIYVSSETHDSIAKAARICGLGTNAIRRIPATRTLQFDVDAAAAAIRRDRRNGRVPLMIVGTIGTTSAGAIDPIGDLAELARRESLWFHVDGAWGGAALLLPEYRHAIPAAAADSMTLDPHKWLSIPMGAGLLMMRHADTMEAAFRVNAAYMPADRAEGPDYYSRSMQWSRRAIAFKVFASLAVAGWSGYEASIRQQLELGGRLRAALLRSRWEVVNETPLPVVCFRRPTAGDDTIRAIAARIVASGNAWISTTTLRGVTVLRACITNHRTTATDISALVRELNRTAAIIIK